jgi:hypothetical protein
MASKKISFASIIVTIVFCGFVLVIKAKQSNQNSTKQVALENAPPIERHDDNGPDYKKSHKTHTSVEDIMHEIASYRLEGKPNQMAIFELKSLVQTAQNRYDEVFKKYQNAISTYEQLSADFDAKVRSGAAREALELMDDQRLTQAQEVLKLKQASNQAYLELMTQYDKAISPIMAKYFERTTQ